MNSWVLFSCMKLLGLGSYSLVKEYQIVAKGFISYGIEFRFVVYGFKESMEGYSSPYVYLCMKNWEIRLKASRLWQNFLKLCAENYSK